MASARCNVTTGWLYRNPKPHIRHVAAYHPSLVQINEKEFLATFDIGQAVEAMDYRTVASRSPDGGVSWELEGPLLEYAPRSTTHSIRTNRLRDGTIVGFGGVHHRDWEDEGIANRANSGLVPIDLILVRSLDGGKTWSRFSKINPPLAAASWEICHPVLDLASGRWLAPTSTWRGWDGSNHVGEQAIVLISDDQGHSWPTYGRTFDGRQTGIHHWEQSVIELNDGRILALSWVYDGDAGKTLPTTYSVSEDSGETFREPIPTGFLAQTCKVIQLRDGDLLCVYRRDDRPGLWATRATLKGEEWLNGREMVLWEGAESGMREGGPSVHRLSVLKFGYPSLSEIAPGEVMVLFWCRENCVTGIRWIRFASD